MDIAIRPTLEIQIVLTHSEAEQLAAMSAQRGLSSEVLIQQVFENFFATHASEQGERGWTATGLKVFEADWDNPADAAYDDWRHWYSIPIRG